MGRGITLFVVVTAAAAGSAVSGEVVVFDNRDGQFEWLLENEKCPRCGPGAALDITQPPLQSGDGNGLIDSWLPAAGTPHWFERRIRRTGPSGWIAADDEPTILVDETATPTPFTFVREFGPGDTVDAGLNWVTQAHVFVGNPYPDPPVLAWIDTPTYVGVRLEIDGVNHYGWVFINRFDSPQLPIDELLPLVWAYETTPETPAVIPELSCAADLDGDTIVGITDFLKLLAHWGTDPGGPPDFDGDGNVGIIDFLELLANWGPCPL